MGDSKVIRCPHCGAVDQWRCYDEQTEIFADADSGEEYEAPVGYLACNVCGKGFAHHHESPNKWLGTWDEVYGGEDE